MNPLHDLIPASYRRYLYAAYGLASLVVGALLVGGVNVGTAPEVITYLGIALGLTAAANTSTTSNGDGE